ncbi:Cyclin-Y protein 1-B [Fasciola hepatica]|uniref:Cyclin-Y protein 1-B n=1 Tax=Fasciola hepatica TaxID=6192 RepID=A0A4E0RWH2_FASHE|nr:Cyclin-Y protein 1-B [Fasciola hepatica]
MGNHIVCCRQRWSQLYNSDEKLSNSVSNTKVSYTNTAARFSGDVWQTSSASRSTGVLESNHISPEYVSVTNKSSVTQHIKEREPEEDMSVPNPHESKVYQKQVPTTPGPTCKHVNPQPLTAPLKRWSSCSTIYIGDSCLVHLNQKSTLWGVSVAVGLLVRSEKNQRFSTPVRCLQLGSLSKPAAPNHGFSSDIYEDIYNIFDERVYSLEIFLERLVNAAEVGILPWSWRRQLLACILLASKVLDDQAVWNTDYCQILRDVCVDDLNALERHTLSLLQFNIDVQPAVYARYYFDLLYVAQASGVANQPSERRRLTAERAQQLRLLPAPTSELANSNVGFLFDLPRIDPLHTKSRESTHVSHLQSTNTRKRSRKHRTASSDKRKTQTAVHVGLTKQSASVLNSGDSGGHARHSVVSPVGAAVKSTSAIIPVEKVDPFTKSTVMYTLEPIPPARSPSSEDEGPLRLDDETDLINTLTASVVASPSNAVLPMSTDANHYDHIHSSETHNDPWASFRSFGNTGVLDGCSTRWDILHSQACDSARVISNETNLNSSGFIRTLMGGDVAYSLLRDAGMY